jgi:hypothetical protein
VAKQPKAASGPASSVRAVDITKVLTTLSGLGVIKTIDDLNAQRANLTQAITELKTHLTAQDAQVSSLTQTLMANQAELLNLQTMNGSLQQQVKTQQASIDELNARLATVSAAPPPSKPGDLADSFRKVVDQIQSQARQQSTSGPATTIRTMDIEVKGLVNVDQDGSTVMVLPTLGTPIDPGHLSTLRVSFASIPGTGSAPPPVVEGIEPSAGPAAGGTTIKIIGSGFTGTGAVLFGGSPALRFEVASDTEAVAVSPPGAGAVDVIVITASGGASAAAPKGRFNYIAAPRGATPPKAAKAKAARAKA